MSEVKAVFHVWFGSLEFKFSSPEELHRKLELVKALMEEVSAIGLNDLFRSEQSLGRVQSLTTPLEKPRIPKILEGVLEQSADGPVIVTREKTKLTQYESIGLILYASEGQISDPKTISLALQNSGIKVSNISARLKEMAKSGRVFKPNAKEALWKLSAQGQSWVERVVIPKLREDML